MYINNFLFSDTYLKKFTKFSISEKENVSDLMAIIKEWHDVYKDSDNSDNRCEFSIRTLNSLNFFEEKVSNSSYLLFTELYGERKPVSIFKFISSDSLNEKIFKNGFEIYSTIKSAKEKGVKYVFISNGYIWRLYNTNSLNRYEYYFEVNLTEILKNNVKLYETSYFFFKFFSAESYSFVNNFKMESFLKESAEMQTTVENTLKGKVESILKDLCYGLKENMNFDIYQESDRKEIFQSSIILLYRMLFFAYAESRNLLPYTEEDREQYSVLSFEELCKNAKDILNNGIANNIKDDFNFWNKIEDKLRVYVDSTYNGGLFNNSDKPLLSKYKISNKFFLKCLAEISYYNNNESYNNKIEFKDLSLRSLGSIYEGLLEFNLFIAEEDLVKRGDNKNEKYLKVAETSVKKTETIIKKGDIYLSQSAMERKDTGSYYTPEDVVNYIIENSIGRKINELKNSLKTRKQLSKEEVLIFINDDILKMTLIDNAMGSGHFLVNSSYYITNTIIELLLEFNINTEDDFKNLNHWKRKVVENCIYGIDLNKLAVWLGRLSLWLVSASNEKPLSFLDHHLKEGNSLLGISSSYIQDEVGDDVYNLMQSTLGDSYMSDINNMYKKLSSIKTNTKKEVHLQKEIYIDIDRFINKIKDYYDVVLYSKIKNLGKKELMEILCDRKKVEDIKKDDIFNNDLDKFFHWDIEFPQVFEKGGFDVVIGNPPYVGIDKRKYQSTIKKTLDSKNIYSYMIEKAILHLKAGGVYGFIVPVSSISSMDFESLQKLLFECSGNIFFSSYGTRPSRVFKSAEQRVTIMFGSVKENKKQPVDVFSAGYKRWYADQRDTLFEEIEYTKLERINYKNGSVPKISNSIEKTILDKIYKINVKLGQYITKEESSNQFIYHSAARYWLKSFDFVPYFYTKSKGETLSSSYKIINILSNLNPNVFIALINSTLFYWHWVMFSDERSLSLADIKDFPFDYSKLNVEQINKLNILIEKLMNSYKLHSHRQESKGGAQIHQEFKPKHNKHIVDEIDELFGEIYGFDKEELSFIKNFEIKFRLGRDGNEA